MQVVVRRSALRMWLFAILGVPFIIFGIDILGGQQLTTRLTDIIYPGDNVLPPPIETHEFAWAWVFLIAGGLFTGWALKELIAPRRVLQADWRGVTASVGGPFKSAVLIPWSSIDDVRAGIAIDGESEFPVLAVDLNDRGDIPLRPWGARWVGPEQLAIATRDWEFDTKVVATELRQLAAQVLVETPDVGDDGDDPDRDSAPISHEDLSGWELVEIEPPTTGADEGILP